MCATKEYGMLWQCKAGDLNQCGHNGRLMKLYLNWDLKEKFVEDKGTWPPGWWTLKLKEHNQTHWTHQLLLQNFFSYVLSSMTGITMHSAIQGRNLCSSHFFTDSTPSLSPILVDSIANLTGSNQPVPLLPTALIQGGPQHLPHLQQLLTALTAFWDALSL